jgi:glycosyltransferase involved in cell wall biosynthesis
MSVRVLHVMQRHTLGGASRSLLALASHPSWTLPVRHAIVSLVAPEPRAVDAARARGIDVIAAPDELRLTAEIAGADLVQVHYWNTPELQAFMRGTVGPMRTVIWCHVAGDTAPHVVAPELVRWGDVFVACCRYTASLPVFRDHELASRCVTIVGTSDFERVRSVRPQPHAGFNVGYIGTVDFSKMDPRYVPMHAAIRVPELRCLVYGGGDGFRAIAAEAARLGVAGRFELGGYAHDIGSVIARLDVFGYPLAPETFAATELVLQEVMYAGVPPVIFRRGGAQCMVEHERTGLIVDSEADYVAAIEYLHARPEERTRIGAAAAAEARRQFDPARAPGELQQVYETLLEQPKRDHRWPGPRHAGAAVFVDSLNGLHAEFAASLHAGDADNAFAADDIIRRAPETITTAAAGGVLHYRRAYPSDPHLRLWSGLVFLQAGRPALAAAEFHAARLPGPAGWRASWYLAEAALAGGARALARQALTAVTHAAPEFAPARDRLRAITEATT